MHCSTTTDRRIISQPRYMVVGRYQKQNTFVKSRPVARFQDMVGHNTFLGGHDFCFYYMFETTFSGRNKVWRGTKEI